MCSLFEIKACILVGLEVTWLNASVTFCVSHRSLSGMWAVPSSLMLLAISNPKDQVANPKKTRRTRPGERWMDTHDSREMSRAGTAIARAPVASVCCFYCGNTVFIQQLQSLICGKVDLGLWWLPSLFFCLCVCTLSCRQIFVRTSRMVLTTPNHFLRIYTWFKFKVMTRLKVN